MLRSTCRPFGLKAAYASDPRRTYWADEASMASGHRDALICRRERSEFDALLSGDGRWKLGWGRWLRCWRHVHVEGEGFGVGVVVPGIAFQSEGDRGQAVALGILAPRRSRCTPQLSDNLRFLHIAACL